MLAGNIQGSSPQVSLGCATPIDSLTAYATKVCLNARSTNYGIFVAAYIVLVSVNTRPYLAQNQ